jgi:hypothetical protein
MIRKLSLAVVLLLASLAGARAQSCMELDLDDARGRAGQLSTLLKIANFRADVTYMGEVAQELETYLGTCGDEATGRIALVCDHDCHLQLGRYQLFLAADLPFLSSASGVSRNDTPLSPQAAQEIARQGIEVVDRGLRILARQQGGGGDAGEDASYRTFVRQLVGLSALKIQLLMNTGDIWYQTVSEARVKALDFMIANTLGSTSTAALESQPNLSRANTNYEAALWTLVETKMDIPGESTYDDLRADLLLLENDLTERTGSLRRGFLFLNIDPMQFTTIPFEDLRGELAQTRADLERVEDKVESIVERWHANKLGEATRALDEERTIRSQEVNLLAHRIGRLEQESRVFANTVQQELNAVDAERDSFGFRQQIRGLEILLATKLAEFENQRRQIRDRSELDLLVLSKEAESERRNELRWLINFEMTRMNIELQLSSLVSQITEYDRQTARNTNQLEQFVRQRGILETQIENTESGIAQALDQIEELELRRTTVYAQSRAVTRQEICSIETQLAFIGETVATPFSPLLPGEQVCQTPVPTFTRTQFTAQMCGTGGQPGLRAKLLDGQIQARAFVMKCVVGSADFSDLETMVGSDQVIVSANGQLAAELAAVDCGNFTTTETDFARKVWNMEKTMFEEQAADLAEQTAELNAQIKFVEDWSGTFTNTIVGLQTGLAVVQGTYASVASIPRVQIAAAGLASGVYTTVDAATPVYAVLEGLRNILDTTLKIGQIQISNELQIKALTRQLTQIRQANERIDFQKAMKSVALHNAHFQLAGRRAQGLDELKQLALQSSVAALDCSNQALGIDEQVARLRADHARQLAALDLHASENDLVSFQISAQQRAIDRATNEIEILRLELQKLDLAEAQLAEDNGRIGELVAAARARIARVEAARGTVEGLSAESSASTNIINELRERQGQKMLALSDAELGFVERRIAGETSNTQTLVDGLDKAITLGLKSRELQASILAFQGSVMAEVDAQQEELTGLVSQIDDLATRRNLFIADQETLSELMKGIPEYLVAKRRSLETANLLLHLMRRRFEVVNAVTGGNDSAPDTYVRNATQLAALVQDIVNKRFFDERQINIDVAQIVVPANSGFARKLALTDAVDFEISPFASSDAAMKAAGYFSLWAPSKFRERRNLTLIDAFIGTQYQCTGAQWNRFALQHRGSGFVFKPVTEGSREVSADISIGPERLALQTFFNLADSQDEVNRIIRYWVQDRFQVRNFPRRAGPPNDTDSVLPYLGAPVIGSYRLSLQPSDCPFDNAVFTLYVIFASAP